MEVIDNANMKVGGTGSKHSVQDSGTIWQGQKYQNSEKLGKFNKSSGETWKVI